MELCVKLHDHLTNWFGPSVGVWQGGTLSPMLFNLFVNKLASEVKSLNCGVKLGDTTISILLYADDIALILNQKILYRECWMW